LIQLGHGFVEGFFIISLYRQLQQAGDVFRALSQAIDGFNNRFQCGTLFPQRLCTLRFVPNVRLFQLGVYFFKAFLLGIIVKDTP